jgi:hypothetical protein
VGKQPRQTIDYSCEDGFFGRPRVKLQFQTPIRFAGVKQGLILVKEARNRTYLIQLNVRKPLMISISQKSEELTHYKLV